MARTSKPNADQFDDSAVSQYMGDVSDLFPKDQAKFWGKTRPQGR